MTKHSELDNTIAEFTSNVSENDFVPAELLETAKMLDGTCCAIGHARRYVQETLIEMGVERYAINEAGSTITVAIFRHSGEVMLVLTLLRWKAVRGANQ